MSRFTEDQVTALAPDAASIKQGRGLANPAKWPTLFQSDEALWGECKGSGKNPYRTGIDLRELAFKCSCPSRKFPCKHSLGLLYLHAQSAHLFTKSETEGWIAEWLEKRSQSAERKAAKQANESQELTPEQIEKREKAAAKRSEKREQNIATAIDDVQLWINDMLRQGFAAVRSQPLRSFDKVAARLVDLQAPGLARLARLCGEDIASGDQWAERLTERIALINLLLNAYRNIERLPEASQSDIRTAIGRTTSESEVLSSGTRITDTWTVVGQLLETEGTLRQQRSWLYGEQTNAFALHLSFAAGQQTLDTSLPLCTSFEAEIAYYPASVPLRAVIVDRKPSSQGCHAKLGSHSISGFLEQASRQFATNPWLERLPCLLTQVAIVREAETWYVADRYGKALSLSNPEFDLWQLFSLCTGATCLNLFGEWDGQALRIASSLDPQHFLSFATERIAQ